MLILITVSSCEVPTGREPGDNSKWTYHTNTDEMTSEKTYKASLYSDEKLSLNPYFYSKHPLFPEIELMRDSLSNNVFVSASSLGDKAYDGVFNVDDDNKTIIEIKFDNEKAIDFTATAPEREHKDFVSIDSAELVIAKLKKAKRVLIRATFNVKEPDRVVASPKLNKKSLDRATITEGARYQKTAIMKFVTEGLRWKY